MSFLLSHYVPVWLVELGGIVILIAVIIELVFKLRNWIKVLGPVTHATKLAGVLKNLTSLLKISITQNDVIVDSKLRLVMHQFMFWGFILCGISTTLVWLTGTAERARTLTDIPKIFGNIGGLLLLIGCGYVLLRLVAVKEFRRNRSVGDLLFFLSLFIVTVTGFTTQYYRLSGDPVMALSNYITHLAANVILLGAAPFTHFFHAISTPFLRIFTLTLKTEELRQIKAREMLHSLEDVIKKR
jgi:hypothetical protein